MYYSVIRISYTYIISQDLIDQVTQPSKIVSGYLLGRFEGEYIIIDSSTLEKTRIDPHVRPKQWAIIKKYRVRTLRQLQDDRERQKEREVESAYIRDHEQHYIDDYIQQNRATVNAKQAVRDDAAKLAKGKGSAYRAVYHFHTHPDQSIALTEVDLAMLQYMGSGMEVVITSSAVIGYNIISTEGRPKYRITEIPFQIT